MPTKLLRGSSTKIFTVYNIMNKKSEIFLNQPLIGEGEDSTIGGWVANWQTTNAWLQTHPSLESLKKACLFEAERNRRPQILDRILSRVFKMEKAEALKKLLTNQ